MARFKRRGSFRGRRRSFRRRGSIARRRVGNRRGRRATRYYTVSRGGIRL